jgi:hypothetical protein
MFTLAVRWNRTPALTGWPGRRMPALGLGLFALAVWWVSSTAGVMSDKRWWEEWGMGARRVPRCYDICEVYIDIYIDI